MTSKSVFILFLIAAPVCCRGDEMALPFPQVWRAVRSSSPSQKAAVSRISGSGNRKRPKWPALVPEVFRGRSRL